MRVPSYSLGLFYLPALENIIIKSTVKYFSVYLFNVVLSTISQANVGGVQPENISRGFLILNPSYTYRIIICTYYTPTNLNLNRVNCTRILILSL